MADDERRKQAAVAMNDVLKLMRIARDTSEMDMLRDAMKALTDYAALSARSDEECSP